MKLFKCGSKRSDYNKITFGVEGKHTLQLTVDLALLAFQLYKLLH